MLAALAEEGLPNGSMAFRSAPKEVLASLAEEELPDVSLMSDNSLFRKAVDVR
jgi:hypothetical protein